MEIEATQAIPLSDYEDGDETDDEPLDGHKKPAAHLKVLVQKGFPETLFPVYEGINMIGRAPGCNIQIDLKALSKKHALIEVQGSEHFLVDKGSKNKTRRNKIFLKPEVRYEISDGQQITFADVECVYLLEQKKSAKVNAEIKESFVYEEDDSDPSSDLLQPTQGYAGERKPVSAKKVNFNAAATQLYAPDSDESDGDHSTPFAKKHVVMETPALSKSKKRMSGETVIPESDVEPSPIANISMMSRVSAAPTETICYASDEELGESRRSVDRQKKLLSMAATQAYVADSEDAETDDEQGAVSKPLATETNEPTQAYNMDVEDDKTAAKLKRKSRKQNDSESSIASPKDDEIASPRTSQNSAEAPTQTFSMRGRRRKRKILFDYEDTSALVLSNKFIKKLKKQELKKSPEKVSPAKKKIRYESEKDGVADFKNTAFANQYQNASTAEATVPDTVQPVGNWRTRNTKNYTKENMPMAINMVLHEKILITKAAKICNVNRQLLADELQRIKIGLHDGGDAMHQQVENADNDSTSVRDICEKVVDNHKTKGTKKSKKGKNSKGKKKSGGKKAKEEAPDFNAELIYDEQFAHQSNAVVPVEFIEQVVEVSATEKSNPTEYTHENIPLALDMVINHNLELNKAARICNVNRKTLALRLQEVRGEKPAQKPTICSWLTEEDELEIVQYWKELESYGEPPHRNHVRPFIVDLVQRKNRKCRLNMETGPKDDWFLKFLKKYSELKEGPPNYDALRQKRSQYDANALDQAVQDVMGGKMTYAKASRTYGVPRKSIYYRIEQINLGKPVTSHSRERRATLSDEDEKTLVEYCIYQYRIGGLLMRKDICQNVVEYLRRDDRDTRISLDNGPSSKWVHKFMDRNPELNEFVEPFPKAKSKETDIEATVDQFFTLYESTLRRLKLTNKPAHIFTCHEAVFGGKKPAKNSKNADDIEPSNHEHLGAYVCVAASGLLLPTCVIHKPDTPAPSYSDDIPGEWMAAISQNGVVTRTIFTKWFTDIFVPNCGPKRPVLLLLNRACSDISLDVIDKARENQIELFGIHSSTLSLLQPLEEHIFRPLKEKEREMVESSGTTQYWDLPQILQYAIDDICTPKRIKNSFLKCGLMPFDPSAVIS